MTAVINDRQPARREIGSPERRHAVNEAGRGRKPEERIVRDALRRAHQGFGGVVLVEGESGIGKSFLLRQAMGEASDKGFSVAAAPVDQLGQHLPFFALRAALGEPFGRQTADGPTPDLADAEWWISRVRTHLEQQAATAPVLVCLDDVQWASSFTLTALRALPLELKHHAVAWLLARTSTAQHDPENLFSLLENEGAARISLTPLEDDVVAALLIEAFGAPPDVTLLALASGAGGNPALLTELICGLTDDEAVQVTGDRAVLVSTDLPRRVLRVAQRRIDGLSTQGRHLLVTAAMLGPGCRLEDAAEMLGETPAALLPALEELMSSGIMTASDNEFSFRQELLRRALGELIPRPARQALHRHYGQILLNRGRCASRAAFHLLKAAHPDDPASLVDLDTAAAHTLRSNPQTAADLALRALELTSSDNPDLLTRAVVCTEALTAAGRLDEAGRLARSTMAKPLPSVADARIRCALSTVLRARGQVDEAADQADNVLARPQLPPDLREDALTAYLLAVGERQYDRHPTLVADTILANARQHESHTTMAAMLAAAAVAWDNGQISQALAVLRDAARHDGRISPDARHPQPSLGLAAALVDLRQLQEADAILDTAGLPALPGIPVQAAASILRARIHLANGRLPEAEVAGHAALADAETVGADSYGATAHCVLAMIALRRGDIARAAQHIANLPDALQHAQPWYARAEITLAKAQIAEARDGPAAAINELRQAAARLPASKAMLLGDPAVAAWMVRTSLAAGDQPLASQVAHTAKAISVANPGFLALAAAAAHSQGLATRDTALLARAAAQHPDRWTRASAAEDLAVLLTDTTKDQAITHLKSSLDGYRQAGAERDQARIRRRLRALGIHRSHWSTVPSRPVTGWDSLTDTEQAVARLVAEGLNNRQVASRIYISSHTVAHHLRQAFRKLDIASRVELARIVIEEAPACS